MSHQVVMKAYHRNKTGGLACYTDTERLTVEGVKQFRAQVVIEVFEFPHLRSTCIRADSRRKGLNSLEELINQIEHREAYEDMHFSLYYIPTYYNEEEPS